MSERKDSSLKIKVDADVDGVSTPSTATLPTTTVNDIYSQAAGGNIDFDFNARTGRIESNIILGTVSSGFASPVTFNHTLSLGISQYYGSVGSATESTKCQFGLNKPSMSADGEGRAHFASGMVDNVVKANRRNADDGAVELEAHRELDVKIEAVYQGTGEQRVLQGFKADHINGTVEYYDAQGRMKEMRSESGHGLKFTVAHDPWLKADIITRIEDDENINWLSVTVHQDPTSEASERYMDVQQHVDGVTITTRVVLGATSVGGGTNNNIYVKRVSLPNDTTRWIAFTYDQEKSPAGCIISKVTLPTGQFIRVSQKMDLKFSDTQTFSVGTQVLTGAQQEGIEKVFNTANYSYGTTSNFTGYKAGRTMVEMADNCATLTENYTYTVTATHPKSRVITTYNRFHLPVSTTTEEIRPGQTTVQRIVTQYTYPIVLGDIAAQSANFSRWTLMTVDHEEVTVATDQVLKYRRNQARRTFDEHGNLLSQTLPSGIIEEYTYYPKNSTEATGCPPSADFVRFLHTKTVRPKAGLPVPSGGNHTETYTYSAVAGISYTNPLDKVSTVAPSMTLKKSDMVNDLTVANYRYTTDISTPFLLGTLHESSSSSNGIENKTSVSWALVNYQGMRIVEATTYIWATGQATATFMGLSKFSPLSGLVYEEEDSAGSITLYVYDATRHLIQTKSYANTPQEEVTSYDFRYWSNAFRDHISTPAEYRNFFTNRVKITSPVGKITCWHFDHEGQPVIVSHADSDDFTQVATITVYDRSNGSAEAVRHHSIDYVATSPTDPTPKQLNAISTYEHRLFGTTRVVNPDGTALNADVDKAATPYTLTTYADATPNVKSIQKFNDFGDVYETQLMYPEGSLNPTVTTSSKAYDGFGRVILATVNGTTTSFAYDQLNRMTTKITGNETTNHTYGSDLTTLGELTRIQASYRRNGEAAVTLMNATRTFDNFGRIVEQQEPNYDASGVRKVSKRIRYRSPAEQAPNWVDTGRGSIAYTHNSLTGQLDSFEISGGAAEKKQRHSATYAPVSKSIKSASSQEFDPNFGYYRDVISHSYNYDLFGAATTIRTLFGINPTGAITHNSFSRFSTVLERMELLDLNSNLICRESSFYDNLGRLTRQEFVTGSGLNFHAAVAYSPVERGSAGSGKPLEIKVTDSSTRLDILRIYFSYDKFGNENNRRVRVMVNGAEFEALTFNQVTGLDGNAQSRSVAYQPPFNGQRSNSTTSYEYTPNTKYLQKSTTDQGWRTYTANYENTEFSAVGGISYEMPAETLNLDFFRLGDQPGSMINHIGGSEVRAFQYDDNGNVASISITAGSPSQLTSKELLYNAMNQLLKVSNNGLDIARYDYDFFGKLVKITNIAKNKTRCLLYGADGLLGEIGAPGDDISRTVYINVGGVSIGRYVQKASGQSPVLELFATDTSGTVHGVYKYVDARINPNNAVNFTYLDDGLRDPLVSEDQLDCPIGFKGYFIDWATGCYVLGDGFRFYDPIMRQFWSTDSISPFGTAGPNRYHYCGMDPINRTDHSGNDWGWQQRLNRPWWKRWGWVIAETLIGTALGALTGFLIGGPAGAMAGAIAGGVTAGVGASLKAAAEEVILADSGSRTDPTRGDYYIPPAAKHLDNVGYGIDLAVMFAGNLAGSGVAKPSMASKAGQSAASSVSSAGSRAGSAGSTASGLSSAATGGKQATSGTARSLPGLLGKGRNVQSSLQKHHATGGFKSYPVTVNGRPHTIHLSKTETDFSRVGYALVEAYLDDPTKTIHIMSGAHGKPNGHIGLADARFLPQDMQLNANLQSMAATNGWPAPRITHSDIGQSIWQANKAWAQDELKASAAMADHVIYAFCYSGLNNGLRAHFGIRKVLAPWRWLPT
ncbi:RHS repeat-associated core domain-containing protein [Pseudomonas moorei]|uniref:RHS repeat-associated core domain-containing protein n=1 Tax=Pseudomonas moorei TaxID=395599 RepID=UPI0020103DCD|nr:RHS repeat-associated core domain-containing protein [Pseudomonas moorei]